MPYLLASNFYESKKEKRIAPQECKRAKREERRRIGSERKISITEEGSRNISNISHINNISNISNMSIISHRHPNSGIDRAEKREHPHRKNMEICWAYIQGRNQFFPCLLCGSVIIFILAFVFSPLTIILLYLATFIYIPTLCCRRANNSHIN